MLFMVSCLISYFSHFWCICCFLCFCFVLKPATGPKPTQAWPEQLFELANGGGCAGPVSLGVDHAEARQPVPLAHVRLQNVQALAQLHANLPSAYII